MFNKSNGNINNLPDFTCENATINSATITNLSTSAITHPTMVTSTNTITDNAIVKGDGGSRGVQPSGVSIDDSNNITGVNSISISAITLNGNMNIPHDDPNNRGYFIGSQPILYRDGSATEYKIEVDRVKANKEVEINEATIQIKVSNTNFNQIVNVNDTTADRTY